MKIDSWDQLQAEVPSILDRINASPDLAIAAAANPLYALEELGYEIAPAARPEIEERVRFGPRTVVRLRQLRERIFREAGRTFDPHSLTDVRRVFDELNLRVSDETGGYAAMAEADALLHARPPQVGWQPQTADPLETLRGAHPIIEPLLEYRRLEASEPHLAPRDLYREVRSGRRRTPILALRARLHHRPIPGAVADK